MILVDVLSKEKFYTFTDFKGAILVSATVRFVKCRHFRGKV